MKITIVYDNTVYTDGLESDWGFACTVETDSGQTILFDTGAQGDILLSNMDRLGIDPNVISTAVISHDHWDHTGGLGGFLSQNRDISLYVPGSSGISPEVKECIPVNEQVQITEGVYSTGELEGIEQSICLETSKGILVIAGCSHPGVGKILDKASECGKVHALIGGLHGFSDFDRVKELDLICATHCTQHIDEIKELYSDAYEEGGAGRIFEF